MNTHVHDFNVPPPVPAGSGEAVQLSWQPPSGIIGLSVVNFVLRILTLGIYHFWGKTEVRRRIWSGIRLNSEPLQYTGTGKELFLGFLIIFGFVLLPVLLVSVAATIAFGPGSPALAIFQFTMLFGFLFLTGIATYRAQRYRLSRTRWRGIRGAVVGSSLKYGWTYFWTAFLIPLTLGWIVPWRATKLQGLLTNDTRFGSRPFVFNAGTGPLYARFAILWVGMLAIFAVYGAFFVQYVVPLIPTPPTAPTDGAPAAADTQQIVMFLVYLYGGLAVALLFYSLFSAWYRAAQFNHFAAHTHYEGATFHGSTTALGFIWLGLTNFLIVVFSLGILSPVAQVRTARYMTEHLAIDGAVPLSEIAQAAAQDIRRGEGLAEAFDVDAF